MNSIKKSNLIGKELDLFQIFFFQTWFQNIFYLYQDRDKFTF